MILEEAYVDAIDLEKEICELRIDGNNFPTGFAAQAAIIQQGVTITYKTRIRSGDQLKILIG